jgi:hypothetical protein
MKSTAFIDFDYGLDLLEKIGAIKVNGTPLSHLSVSGGYNIWHAYRSTVLFGDIKKFMGSDLASRPVSKSNRIKDALGYAIAIAFSLGALVRIFVRRPNTLVYSIDKTGSVRTNDFRLDGMYDFLHKNGISFVEIFHTILGRRFVDNVFRRRRGALYLEAIDALYGLTLPFRKTPEVMIDEEDIGRFPENEQVFVRAVARKYFLRKGLSEFRIRFLTKILSLSAVRSFWTIDDARNYNEIIIACRVAGISSRAFQHGFYSKYFVGYLSSADYPGQLIAPDRLFVWSAFWKSELLRLGSSIPAEDIMVGGRQTSHPVMPPPENDALTGILVLYENEADKEKVREYIEAMLSDSSIKVFFKVRPDKDAAIQVAEYGVSQDLIGRLHVVSDIPFSYIDVIVGTYSTLLYEMVECSRPVAILSTRNKLGIDMVESGLADLVESTAGVGRRLAEIAGTQGSVIAARRDKLVDWAAPPFEDTLRRLAEEDRLVRHT